jgi:diguanylate cyclase (GGDEF)-like protein
LFVFPESTFTQAFLAVERIRSHFQRLTSSDRFAHLAKGVTASCGLVEFPTSGRTLEELLTKADQNLYLAKRNGRNRTVAGEGGDGPVLTVDLESNG